MKLPKSLSKITTTDIYKLYKKGGGILSKTVFNSIVNTYNTKCIDRCMVGEDWDLHANLGFFKVITVKRKFRINEEGNILGAIDWKKSNELKAKLIEDGKTPYKATRDEKGNIVGDNGGVKWVVYRTDDHYFLLRYIPNIFLSNGTTYTFKPKITLSRKLAKLHDNPASSIIFNDGFIKNEADKKHIEFRNSKKSS